MTPPICGMDNTIRPGGEEGDCIFCGHHTMRGTPWPKGGVVCPCGSCLLRGLSEYHHPGNKAALNRLQTTVALGELPDSPHIPEKAT